MTRDGWRREDEREEAGWCGSPPSPSTWPSSWQRAVMGRVSEQAPILSPEPRITQFKLSQRAGLAPSMVSLCFEATRSVG